jgi:hypothetical protein
MKPYMFRTVALSIIRSSFSLYTQKTRMTYTTAVCTVKNYSRWWTEELSERCKSFISRINLKKLVHLVGSIIRNGKRNLVMKFSVSLPQQNHASTVWHLRFHRRAVQCSPFSNGYKQKFVYNNNSLGHRILLRPVGNS